MEIPGHKVKEYRIGLGLNQAELGARIGVSSQQIMRYEVHGIQNMRARRLVDFCKEFGCTSDELLDMKGGDSE